MSDDFKRQMMTAQMHANHVRHLADTNQLTWTRMSTPHPTAMQSFQGVAEGYTVLVVQATTKEYGNVFELMITTTSGQIIHLDRRDPQGTPQHLFQKAEAALA